jgi:hypothetical protein
VLTRVGNCETQARSEVSTFGTTASHLRNAERASEDRRRNQTRPFQGAAVCQAHILAGRERAYRPEDGEIKYGWRCEQIMRQSTAQLIGK